MNLFRGMAVMTIILNSLITLEAAMRHSGIFFYGNRDIKTQSKLPLQFCRNGFKIIIGQLGLVLLTNRETEGKDETNKLVDQQNKITVC